MEEYRSENRPAAGLTSALFSLAHPIYFLLVLFAAVTGMILVDFMPGLSGAIAPLACWAGGATLRGTVKQLSPRMLELLPMGLIIARFALTLIFGSALIGIGVAWLNWSHFNADFLCFQISGIVWALIGSAIGFVCQ